MFKVIDFDLCLYKMVHSSQMKRIASIQMQVQHKNNSSTKKDKFRA